MLTGIISITSPNTNTDILRFVRAYIQIHCFRDWKENCGAPPFCATSIKSLNAENEDVTFIVGYRQVRLFVYFPQYNYQEMPFSQQICP